MKVKVKDNACHLYCKSFVLQQIPYKPYADILQQVQGTVLEVDTKYLFLQSVNAIYFEDNDPSKRRIMDLNHRLIEWIKDDERIGTYKCQWCGNHQKGNDSPCQCGQSIFAPIWRDSLSKLMAYKGE